MAVDCAFSEDDMAIEESVGYPRAYAMLCRDLSTTPYCNGPPFTFIPCSLQHHEAMKAKELDKKFEIIDPKAKPTTKPKIFVSVLWKQLDHLGNAGFDPAVIRVDPYGNVLYYNADSASPLSWDIDHWFPCSRGGLTVLSNLRILQWQVCKKKHNKLEFLIPWWEFQLGISVNQFLSIFASSNSDFRHRAFSFLFAEGENEELNSSQTVDLHSFPQRFVESKEKLGLAPAAVVVSRRREPYGSSLVLRSLDYNRQLRSQSPAADGRRVRPGASKENENPNLLTNPYQAIVMARDSLKQREETLKKQSEIQKLDDEVSEMRLKNEEEDINIQDLELALIKRKRKAEKCRRLAEAQSSYKNMLEKMIRDTMHQSVIYKEQLRLNQAASNALMARLEAQKAIWGEAEKDLHKKYKQRDELEKQIRSEWEQGRKRLRMNDDDDDDTLVEDGDNKAVHCLPRIRPIRTSRHKELSGFLEEKASEAGISMSDEEKREEIDKILNRHLKVSVVKDNHAHRDHDRSIVAMDNGNLDEHNLGMQEIEEENRHEYRVPALRGPEIEEEEESRKQRGKGNVEKWLQILLEDSNTQEEMKPQDDERGNKTNKTDDIIRKINLTYPLKEIKNFKHPELEDKEGMTAAQIHQKQQQIGDKDDGKGKEEETNETEKSNKNVARNSTEGVESCKSLGGKERREQNGKERKIARSDSARAFSQIPSSPSLILGMKKNVDSMGKKPNVSIDDEEHDVENSFIKSSIKIIKKAVKL